MIGVNVAAVVAVGAVRTGKLLLNWLERALVEESRKGMMTGHLKLVKWMLRCLDVVSTRLAAAAAAAAAAVAGAVGAVFAAGEVLAVDLGLAAVAPVAVANSAVPVVAVVATAETVVAETAVVVAAAGAAVVDVASMVVQGETATEM